MDDDLQHDPIYIEKILSQLKNGYDSCYVKYKKRKHSNIKVFVSWLNHITSSYLSEKTNSLFFFARAVAISLPKPDDAPTIKYFIIPDDLTILIDIIGSYQIFSNLV